MPNLADSLQCKQFVAKLEKCEAISDNLLSQWESTFIQDMREKFETRETMIDLGMNPWNPTANQINTLSEIAGKYGS
jgi:hypothetical protein